MEEDSTINLGCADNVDASLSLGCKDEELRRRTSSNWIFQYHEEEGKKEEKVEPSHSSGVWYYSVIFVIGLVLIGIFVNILLQLFDIPKTYIQTYTRWNTFADLVSYSYRCSTIGTEVAEAGYSEMKKVFNCSIPRYNSSFTCATHVGREDCLCILCLDGKFQVIVNPEKILCEPPFSRVTDNLYLDAPSVDLPNKIKWSSTINFRNDTSFVKGYRQVYIVPSDNMLLRLLVYRALQHLYRKLDICSTHSF